MATIHVAHRTGNVYDVTIDDGRGTSTHEVAVPLSRQPHAQFHAGGHGEPDHLPFDKLRESFVYLKNEEAADPDL
jgi:hypothetical protein